MSLKFYKHKLLLDEGIFSRKSLKRINSRYNIKHIKHDLDRGGIEDTEVYKIACDQERIIITYNIKDFKKFATKNKKTGIIGINQSVTPDYLDSKLNALLSKNPVKRFYGRFTPLN